VSNHLRAKFGVIRPFPDKQFVNRLTKNFKPSLKMFKQKRRFFVQILMNGKRIAELNDSALEVQRFEKGLKVQT